MMYNMIQLHNVEEYVKYNVKYVLCYLFDFLVSKKILRQIKAKTTAMQPDSKEKVSHHYQFYIINHNLKATS